MTTFADDFNRPDGDLGNGWTYQAGYMRIQSGKAYTTLNRFAGRDFSATGYVHVGGAFRYNNAPSSGIGSVYLKGQTYNTYHYRLSVTRTGSGINASLLRWGTITGTTLDIGSRTYTPGEYVRLDLYYDAGALRGYVDGVLVVEATDTTYAAYSFVGFGFPTSYERADDFDATDAPPVAFDAEPEPLVEMAIPEEVTFTGTGTAWEPGTPGQPVFQVDKGTLDSQTVTSATTASAMYTPPQADDVATFTDPSTGLTDQVALSTGFQVDGGAGLSDEAVAYIEASAAQNNGAPGVILSTSTPITPYGTGISLDLINARLYAWVNTMAGDVPQAPPTMSLFDTLWWILNGHGDVDEDHNVLDYANTAAVEATNATLALSAIRTDQLYTIQTILDAIEATIPPDLSEIEAQLAAIRTVEQLTLADPIAAVEAARGSGLPTVRDVLDELDAIRTPNNWTLGTVFTWINQGLQPIASALSNISSILTGISAYLSGTVLPAIHAIGGADDVDLTEIHDQVGQFAIDTAGHFGHVDSAIAGVRGLDARDLTQVYDAIGNLPQEQVSLQPVLTAISNLSAQVTQSRDAILAAIAAIRPADYPLWPGAGAAELGVPVSGSGDLAIPGPLDGLLVDVTAYPTEIRAWTVAGRAGLKWAGHVTFVSDIGYTEEIQFPGTDKRVLVPKSMLTCASALVHLRAGVQATVTPWYYAP